MVTQKEETFERLDKSFAEAVSSSIRINTVVKKPNNSNLVPLVKHSDQSRMRGMQAKKKD